MFDNTWENKPVWLSETRNAGSTRLNGAEIGWISSLVWEEHCTECAVPECYKLCPLYIPRADGACARFEYGVVMNENFFGLYHSGADIKFRKWGKLEADLNTAKVTEFRAVTEADYPYGYTINDETEIKSENNGEKNGLLFDEFIIECYSDCNLDYKLILEYFTEYQRFRKTKYRGVVQIKKGYNIFNIPFNQFKMDKFEGYFFLQPECEIPSKRLIFTFLDFVRYKNGSIKEYAVNSQSTKIKCVIWDLDNTLWNGILAEDHDVYLKPEALELIRKLDQRGILQSIVSKNDFTHAHDKLKEFGIAPYFLRPMINWGKKSDNIRIIADELNVDYRYIGFIDDSEFEREEVKYHLPSVRTYADKSIDIMHLLPEFNVPVTSEARQRRMIYIEQTIRNHEQQQFDGSYNDFLRSCKMSATAFMPQTVDDLERCWELLQRSNQLNISGARYSFNELISMIRSQVFPIAIAAHDKFGNYGTIGYVSLQVSNNAPCITDFVLSCRIAQKKIEHYFFYHLAQLLSDAGFLQLIIKLKRTSKNAPLRHVFTVMPFSLIKEEDDMASYVLNFPVEFELFETMAFEFTKEFDMEFKQWVLSLQRTDR